MCERLGMSRNTLIRLEKGDSAVSLGTYIKALSILSLQHDMKAVADNDKVGRALQDQREAGHISLKSVKKHQQIKKDMPHTDQNDGQSMADILSQQNSKLVAEILNKTKGRENLA